ncbi:MAG: GNAT family N-acetyltransferase [Candidatus Heimdallarchaeaceae archaeon]
MVLESNQIKLRKVNLLQWRSFKKNFRKLLFPSDPEVSNYSPIMRFFMFVFIGISAENYYCYYKDEQAGILSLRTKKGTDAFIYGIAVLPKFRKEGLGKFMMDFSESRAKETQKKYLALVVLGSNIPAVNLYKKMDYKIVGNGVTTISISLDKVVKTTKNTIKLELVKDYTNEIKEDFSDIFLSQVKTISQNDGVDYNKENRIDAYHKDISKNISKANYQFLQVSDNEENIGYLICRNKGTTKSCSIYLQTKVILTVELLSKLAYQTKVRIEENDGFEELQFRVFIHQADKIIEIQKSDFIRDSTLDKYLMIKKI